MSAPWIEIDLDKVEHNTRVLVDRLAGGSVAVIGVTKATLGLPGVAAAMIRGGAGGLADSRVESLAHLVDVAGPGSRTLIRSPMLSRVGEVIAVASASLNTQAVVVAALDLAARRARTRHGVVLMVELGDLREGIAVPDVAAAVRVVLGSGSLRLLGLGANLACQNGIVPDDTNMGVLDRVVEEVEAAHGITLDVVSGGNSATLDWALSTDHPGRTTELRLGEAILLGTEPLHRTAIPGLHTDAFTLVGEVIEVAEKPARPWGTQAQTSWGTAPAPSGSGTRHQAIVALGRQDVDLEGLVAPGGIEVLGMSSDHLVLDTGDVAVRVGDELRFGLGYGALVRAMTSPFVTRVERSTSALARALP